MIRKIVKISLLLTLLVATLTGCHRQKLEEIVYTKALIPVFVDWQTRALMYVDNDPDEDLYSASVWLFPRDESEYQGKPIEYRLDNAIYDYIEVPVGVYDVLVFNKTVGEYSSNVGFRGTDKFETFEYYTKPYINSKADAVYDGDQELRLEPDLLAAWRSAEAKPLVVTIDMIRQMDDIILCRDKLKRELFTSKGSPMNAAALTRITASHFDELTPEMRQLVDLKAERLTHITPVKEYVKNLYGAKVAVGTLRGMSSSVKLAAAEYAKQQVAYRFVFTSKTIDSKDGKSGYMEARFREIGPLSIHEQADYQMTNVFTLHGSNGADGELYPAPPSTALSLDATDQVYYWQQRLGLDKVIPLEFGYDDDENIELPYTEVGAGGFDVNLSDWEDEIVVPLKK